MGAPGGRRKAASTTPSGSRSTRRRSASVVLSTPYKTPPPSLRRLVMPRPRSEIAFLAAVMLFSAAPAGASHQLGSQERQPLATVPFELVGEKIFMKARVNGSEEINLQFDTGAGSTVIDAVTAESLKLVVSGETTNEGAAGSASVPTSTNNAIEISGLKFPAITLVLVPLGEYLGTKK